MRFARYALLSLLLTACASTLAGAPADASASDAPVSDAGVSNDLTSTPDVATDGPSDADAVDPRCPRRPCLSHPILRAIGSATWLIQPDGRTFVWGEWGPEREPPSSQPGIRYYRPTPGPMLSEDVLDMVPSSRYACSLLANPRRVMCWGSNELGMLGRMTDGGIGGLVLVEGPTDVEALAALGYNTWALSPTVTWVWGTSAVIELPSPETPWVIHSIPTPPMAIRFASGNSLDGWGFLTSDGHIYTLGNNTHGEAAIEGDAGARIPHLVTSLSGVVDYAAAAFASCAVLSSGQVHCWGRRDPFLEQNVQPPTMTAVPERVAGIDDAVRIGLGNRHACVLTRDQRVRCWGQVDWNRPEAGPSTEAPTRPPGPAMELPLVRELAVGGKHTCVLTVADEVYCWGNNESAQLGIPRFGSNSNTPLQVTIPP